MHWFGLDQLDPTICKYTKKNYFEKYEKYIILLKILTILSLKKINDIFVL